MPPNVSADWKPTKHRPSRAQVTSLRDREVRGGAFSFADISQKVIHEKEGITYIGGRSSAGSTVDIPEGLSTCTRMQ